MIRRFLIIAIELVAGLFGVAVLAFAILWWRLSTGPLPLDFVTAYVERAASLETVSYTHLTLPTILLV